jgi:aminocarboxymuconate-semialdehyde decarboxylase
MAKASKAGKSIKKAKTAKRKAPHVAADAPKRRARVRKPLVIDIHAHIENPPEVMAFTRGRTIDSSIPPGTPEKLAAQDRKWVENFLYKQNNFDVRLKEMDRTGVDIQVLTSGILRACTYWAPAEEGLKMDRLVSERIAEMVARKPDRFIGLGSVPLQAPELAARELEHCMTTLGLKGVQIASHVGDPNEGGMELGDARLDPFWAAAERLGAVIYLHPAGVLGERYNRYQLWNSVGQNIEEALAMASLIYEGTMDRFPKLKIVFAHGGGFLPYYAGRVDRNYIEKAFTRVNMTRSPSEYMRDSFWYDSCLYDAEQFDYLVEKVGASRILLGSDFPVGEEYPVEFVRKSRRLSAADKERVLGLNAAELLGLRV